MHVRECPTRRSRAGVHHFFMDEQKNRRVSKPPFRWMLVFLLALAIGIVAAVVWFKFWPESLVESPAAPKPPMHNAPR
jgi:hypothetical protein